MLNGQPISIKENGLLHTPLLIPDSLSLYEVLAHLKSSGVDFAVILNEYALVVGMITLKDVMSIVSCTVWFEAQMCGLAEAAPSPHAAFRKPVAV